MEPGLPEVELSDEAVAVDAEGDDIAVLARRSFWVLQRNGDVRGMADLTPEIPRDQPIPRRAIGRIASSGEGSWDIWSTALGERKVLRMRLDPADTPVPEPADVDPPEEMTLAIARGWPGPPLAVPTSRETTFFHLDGTGSLVAESEDGSARDEVGPVGEPLLALPARGGARIYVSSASLPREPDHLIEYGWDGTKLIERRHSREFDGRIAAVAFHGGTAMVAVVEDSGHTRLVFVEDRDLWAEGS